MDLSLFVGRDTELEQIRALLDSTRLLTLTGAGGSGKTRLAVEVLSGLPAVEALWVELADLDDPELLPQHIAEAAGFPDEVHSPEGLTPLLAGRDVLVVLDNCEHLVDACATLAPTLLGACPELRILATSREALGVRGERAWLVPPLGLPEPASGLEVIGRSEAVRLFVERARDMAPAFELTAENGCTVAEICQAVDGIPLAIELAAARVRVLSTGQILERLRASLDLLASGGRGTLPRHRTLRAALDWSYDLLPDDRRQLLHRLSVFRGGATLEAVETVCAADAGERAGVLDTLASLVDRSLVVVREHQGEARYALLETVRQYARERLNGTDEAHRVRGRHAAFFSTLAAEAEPHLTRPTRPLWIGRLLPELDNLRETLTWTRDHTPDAHVALVGRLWWFWFSTRHWAEGGRWLAEALALPEARAPGRARAMLLFARGALLALQARPEEPRPLLEEAAALARDIGDERLEAYALNYLGLTYAGEGRAEGRALCHRAEVWFRKHEDLYGLRLALLLQGSTAMGLGELEEAKRLNREGVEVARRFGLDREMAISLQNLAAVHLRAGEPQEAERLVLEALAASRRDPSYYFIAVGLSYLAEATMHRGATLEAARLLGAAEALAETIGLSFFRQDRERLAEALTTFRKNAGEEAFDAARANGRLLTPEAVLDEVCGASEGPEPQRAAPAVQARPLAQVPPADLDVKLLGAFQVSVEGSAVPPEAWSYAKPRELLAMLVAQQEGATRDGMSRLLWPDAPASRLKNSFHVTLHHLRKALQRPAWVVLEADRYRVARDVTVRVDAQLFEEEAARALAKVRSWQSEGASPDEARGVVAALEGAAALYAGDLFEGEVVGVWAEEWRDRLRRRAADVHLARGRLLEHVDRPDDAADAFGAATAREPLNEEAHRGLMRCWAASGQRARSLAHYDTLATLLRETLDVDPDPETEALRRTLRNGA